ncbi:MAG: hypothetical protein ACI4SH_01605 [Candidatus Scatosoma sp.]
MLKVSPDPERNYECHFSNGMLGIPWDFPFCPPNEDAYDPISLGDTDVRMLMAFSCMREMAGEKSVGKTEKGLWKRVNGYVSKEGACLAGSQAFCGQPVEGEWACLWGSSHIILLYCDAYERTGREMYKKSAIKSMNYWLNRADKKGDMLYFKNGNAPLGKDGPLLIGWAKAHGRNYPYIISALLRVYEITKNTYYLDCAEAFGRGIVASVQKNMRELAVKGDGSFFGHVPVHTKMLTGMAMLAAVTKKQEFIDFAYKCYSFIVKSGSDFGWYPEFIPQTVNARSEMCVTGDMLETAYYLTQCGFHEEYDRVERTYRNYMQASQFTQTKPFENLYFSLHKAKREKIVKENYQRMKIMEGGFVAQLSINDYITNFKHLGRKGMNQNGFQMMGCCQGAGMNGLYFLYKMLCHKTKEGYVQVNMSLTADTQYARLISDYRSDKKLTIKSKCNASFLVKVPEWAETVYLVRDGRRTLAEVNERYVFVENVQEGEEFAIDYPIVCFTQKFKPAGKGLTETYTIYWQGNQIKEITPKGKYLPIY